MGSNNMLSSSRAACPNNSSSTPRNSKGFPSNTSSMHSHNNTLNSSNRAGHHRSSISSRAHRSSSSSNISSSQLVDRRRCTDDAMTSVNLVLPSTSLRMLRSLPFSLFRSFKSSALFLSLHWLMWEVGVLQSK